MSLEENEEVLDFCLCCAMSVSLSAVSLSAEKGEVGREEMVSVLTTSVV